MDLTLLVMAAGMGSRYGGLKQIDPVGPGGEAVLDYSVYDGLRAGFSRVVFVIRRDIEKEFRRSIGDRFAGKLDVDYVFQDIDALPPGYTVPQDRNKPWGTGHAVLVSEGRIDGPFAVINADDFYGADSFKSLADNFRKHENSSASEYAMIGFKLKDTLSPHGSVARAVCLLDADSYLERIEERTDIRMKNGGAVCTDDMGGRVELTGDELVSMNIWGFQPDIFELLREKFSLFLQLEGMNPDAEFYIPAPLNALIEEGRARIKVLPGGGPWFGITYQEDKPAVLKGIRRLISEGSYPERIWS